MVVDICTDLAHHNGADRQKETIMRKVIKMGQEPIGRDYVAMAMWGRVKAQTFKDKRKVLPRKAKHKPCLDW